MLTDKVSESSVATATSATAISRVCIIMPGLLDVIRPYAPVLATWTVTRAHANAAHY